MKDETIVGTDGPAGGWSITGGILMVICGFLAIAIPFVSSIGIVLLVGWLILFAGMAHLYFAFRTRGIGGILWQVLLGLVYSVAGIYLIVHPLLGLLSLTIVLALFLLVAALLEVIVYFNIRPAGRSGWILFDAVISGILGLMIWARWPSTAAWVLGTLVGISLIFCGISRIMLSSWMRRTVHATA